MQTPPLEAAERFIAGLEDDATQEGVEQLLAKIRASEHVLPRLGCDTRLEVAENYGQLRITKTDSAGNENVLIKYFSLPDRWETGWFHPAHWHVFQTRICRLGYRWHACMGDHWVMDDFGTLVEVPA